MTDITNYGTTNEDWTKTFVALYFENLLNPTIPVHCFHISLEKNQWTTGGILTLFDELRESYKTRFSDLLQRSLSKTRVEKIRKEYLERDENHLKFFPPITAVLLPETEHNSGFATNYDTMTDQESAIKLKGIRIGHRSGQQFTHRPPEQSGVTHLEWDKSKYKAVVIDGQHRLASLRTIGKDVSVSVQLIVFSANTPRLNLIHLTRSLFIDINNNAVNVSEPKLIIIDDKNITRVAARRTICQPDYESAGRGQSEWNPFGEKENWNSWGAPEKGIPSQLVQYPGDEETTTINEVARGVLNLGPTGITSLELIQKRLINDNVLLDKFDPFVEMYNAAAKDEIKRHLDNKFESNYSEKDFEMDRTEQDLSEIIDKDPILKNYALLYFVDNFDEERNDEEDEHDTTISQNQSFLYSYEPEFTERAVEKTKEELVFPLCSLFLNLWWAKEIIDEVRACLLAIDDLEFPIGFKILHAFLISATKQAIVVDSFIKGFESDLQKTPEKARDFEELLKELNRKLHTERLEANENNIFRTSVGQRALVRPLRSDVWDKIKEEINNSARPTQPTITRNAFAAEYSQRINDLRKKYPGIFNRSYRIEIPNGPKFFLWEHILVRKNDADNFTMIYGNRAAQLGGNLLLYLNKIKAGTQGKRDLKDLRKAVGYSIWTNNSGDTLKLILNDKVNTMTDDEPEKSVILKLLKKQRFEKSDYEEARKGTFTKVKELLGTYGLDWINEQIRL